MSCCGSCGAGKPCESTCAGQATLPGQGGGRHAADNPFEAYEIEANDFHSIPAALKGAKANGATHAALTPDGDWLIVRRHEALPIFIAHGKWHISADPVPVLAVWKHIRIDDAIEQTNRGGYGGEGPFEAGETARVLYEAPRERARRSPMVAGSCGPFARIERDPEVFAACRRMAESIGPIDDLEDAWHLAAPQLSKYDQEVGLVVCLSHQGELREVPVEISLGQRSRVAVDPADVLRAVILSGASSWIFLHCHPSGHSAKPSPADIELTKTLQRSNDAAFGKMRGVEPTVVFIGHGVVTAKELGDARTGKVKRMAK